MEIMRAARDQWIELAKPTAALAGRTFQHVLNELGGGADPVRDKPWPSGRGRIARTARPSLRLAVQRGVCCCAMYWRTMEIGAPPQDEAK